MITAAGIYIHFRIDLCAEKWKYFDFNRMVLSIHDLAMKKSCKHTFTVSGKKNEAQAQNKCIVERCRETSTLLMILEVSSPQVSEGLE